jgi:hypothetical protein
MLKADDDTPLAPKDPQFAVAYAAAHAERKKPATGTLFSLIVAYKIVCERGGRLYEADRADIIWLDPHIKAFCSTASAELQFALLIALWTGQRQGDLIKIT